MAKKYYLFNDSSIELKADGVEGAFTAYASTFGGKPDSGGDIIAAGAFNDTLAKGGRNGNGIPMLFNHDPDKVIGVWDSMIEDKRGLKVDGRFMIGTSLGKDVHELVKEGAIKGLSIGYSAQDYEIDKQRSTRTLKKVELWEVSVVTFPMNVRATITGVKALEEAKTPRELERALRDAGLSKNEAMYIVKLAKHGLRDVGASEADALLKLLRDVNSKLTTI